MINNWVINWPSSRKPLHTMSAFVAVLLVLIFSACSSSNDFDEPPEIVYGEDTCDRCMMIINEARFATAYVTSDGETRLFDDIGGMIRQDVELNEDVAVYWVHDYESEEWLKAESAAYVKKEGLITPMGFGIVAFTSQDRAESWAEEEGGVVLTFADLLAAEREAKSN